MYFTVLSNGMTASFSANTWGFAIAVFTYLQRTAFVIFKLGVGYNMIPADKRWPVAFAERIGAEAVEKVTGCPKGCTQKQVRAGNERMDIERNARIRPTTAGGEAKSGTTAL